MSKVKRSQIVFIYDGSYVILNGDPYTGEQRMDDATSKAMVSDVRIKRYIRDYFLMTDPLSKINDIYLKQVDRKALDNIFSKKDQKGMTGSSAQIKLLSKKYPNISGALDLLLKCFDVRVFGGISTSDNDTAQVTGPMQFSVLNSSINKVSLRVHQNTTVLPSDMENKAGSIGTTSLVPYALVQILGFTNPMLAEKTGLQEEDVLDIMNVLWNCLDVCTSRSKQDQTARLLLKINFSNPIAKLADLREKITIKESDSFDLRNISDVTWDFSKLVSALAKDKVESVQYKVEEAVEESFLEQTKEVSSKLKVF